MLALPDIPDFLRRDKDNKLPQIAKPIVYSYTMLSTADTCLHRCYRQYIKRDIKYVETPEMKWGNEVHTAFEYRLGGKPLPGPVYNKDGMLKTPGMQHWEPIVSVYAERKAKPEVKLGITREAKPTGFFDADVFLRGKVDATIIYGTSAFLPDWKTGSSTYENPFELEIQGLLTKAANPHLKKISGHYVWLKENRIGQVYDLSDFASTWARVNNKVEVIEDAMASGEWPKTKGPLCGWCSVHDCEFNTSKSRAA
jgi:PD-(D/E)XK nuclease superfamily